MLYLETIEKQYSTVYDQHTIESQNILFEAKMSPISQIKLRDRERTTGDGAEYEKTKHIKDQLDTNTMADVPTNTYAELTEEVAILRVCT